MSARCSTGLSLVELLLAMALGLVVAWGLVRQYSGGHAAAAQLQARADVQDAGAYALGFLRRSAMGAGYFGCNARAGRLQNNLNGAWPDLFEFDLTRPVQGFSYRGDGTSVDLTAWSPPLAELPREGPGGTLNALVDNTGIRIDRLAPGSDLVVFRRLETPANPLVARAGPDDPLRVANVEGGVLSSGDVALVSSCRQATLFRITGIVPIGGRLALLRVPGAGLYGNAVGRSLSDAGEPFGGDSGPQGTVVGRVLTEIYFVAAGAGPGVLSLWRRSGVAAPVELVEGVTNLRALLGVDGSPDDGLDGLNRYVRFGELQPEHRIRSMALAVTTRRDDEERLFEQVVALRNV